MQITEQVAAAIRYGITTLGIILVYLDLIPGTIWDQLAPALIGLATAAYGIYRTGQIETERDIALAERDLAFQIAKAPKILLG